MPHIASRRLTLRAILEERLKACAGEANINDAWIIGGDLDQPAGPFASTMDVLETGLLDQYGITQIAVVGHPEGATRLSTRRRSESAQTKAGIR